LLAGVIRPLLPLVPKPIVGAVARPYVAGEGIADALRVVRELNQGGAKATVDILGESVTSAASAQAAVFQYFELIDALADSGLDSTVSLKPTMLGLKLDLAYAEGNIAAVYERAHERSVFITIDMEDSSATNATLRIYGDMLTRFGNAGTVLQAYLRRSLSDIAALPLPQPGQGRGDLRLCKGIYIEPAEIAYKGYREVRENYLACLRALFTRGHYVGIATHDEWLVRQSEALLAELSVPRERYEFQMLLGVKPRLRARLIAAGHTLRVYVPYGKDWYAYCVRRLRENPAVAWHVLRALLGRKG
jgi:proline dehydrogenase